MVKNLPAMQEMGVYSLGQEDPLEKGMATLSSTLAWRILWTEEPGRLLSLASRSWTRRSKLAFFTFKHIGNDDAYLIIDLYLFPPWSAFMSSSLSDSQVF